MQHEKSNLQGLCGVRRSWLPCGRWRQWVCLSSTLTTSKFHLGGKRWVKINGLKLVDENSWVKISENERVNSRWWFVSMKAVVLVCPRIIRNNVTILYWFKWLYQTTPRKSLLCWLFYPSPRELTSKSFLHICVCVRVRVCVAERARVCVCLILGKSAEICVVRRKLFFLQHRYGQPHTQIAIWEEWRVATSVVMVFLMRVLPCNHVLISHDDHESRVCACVAARMSLNIYSYYVYWWALQLVPYCTAVGVFVLFEGAVMKVLVRMK